jgi:glycosyltransferase involved in cell wall biosynthesis
MIGDHGTTVPIDLRSHVLEVGFVSDAVLADYRAASDALLVPLADTLASRARWPSKVNPFLAEGRIAVLCDVGDLPRLIADHQAGVVSAPSAQNFADAVMGLFGRPDVRPSLEANARRLARTLSWTELAKGLEGLYETLRSA